MQLFMPSHQADVITVEQPVDLLAGQRHQVLIGSWPAELFFSQALVVEHETIVFPLCTVRNYALFTVAYHVL